MEEEKNSISEEFGFTMTTPPAIILKVQILERRKYLIDAIEEYNNKRFLGAGWPVNKIKSYLFSLYYEVKAGLKKDLSKKEKGQKQTEFERLKDLIKSNEFEELTEAFEMIEDWLYKKNLTKWDLQKYFDTTNAELENMMKNI